MTLVRENYIDFGPTFATEKLEEDHGLKVSRETLRKWMQDAGIWYLAIAQAAPHVPSAAFAPGMLWRVDPDRWL